MSEVFHHGPEVLYEGAPQIVRDIRTNIVYLNGLAPIHEVHATAEDRAPFINKRILIRTRKQAAVFGPDKAGYNIPAALDALFDANAAGTIIVNNVFDPDIHKSGGNNEPDPTEVTTAEITGTVDIAGKRTGLNGAYECYQRFGFFPKIMLSARGELPEVRVEMDIIMTRLKGHAIVDLPIGLNIQQAIESRGISGVVNFNTSSPRTLICYPHILVQDTENGGQKLDPLSTAVAGALIEVGTRRSGVNHSPSNKEIKRALDTETPINWYPSDYQSDTNALNAAGIITTARGFATGIRTWGNRSAAYPTSTSVENFIHAQRILDAAHEAITFFKLQYTDDITTPENTELLAEAVNAWLRTKIGRGQRSWFYDARYSFPRDLNTSEQIADGHSYYKLVSAPISVNERLTTISEIDLGLIGNALQLAA